MLIAAIFTPVITGFVAYFTIRHQRGLASQERAEKRYEKLLDALATLQTMIVPVRDSVRKFADTVWSWDLTREDARAQQVVDAGPSTSNDVGQAMHQLVSVSLRTQPSDDVLRGLTSSAFRKCDLVYRMVDEFTTCARIGVHAAHEGGFQPHERLKFQLTELLKDIDAMLDEVRKSDPVVARPKKSPRRKQLAKP
ncbi:hypothetical protein [Rhodococcus koreensis]|uniref:hypothetical protein n=1 Tax=Rhodococcus koreensis TaxID=99653 RepID=UPI003672D953